jgi:hypothetical protein
MDEIPLKRKISLPITITSNQSSLNNMRFDPNQNSPPTLWKLRLDKRVGSNSPIKHICIKQH